MAFANFNIRPTSSTLSAGGSGVGFNAPALPNLSGLFNRPSNPRLDDDWKMKYQARKEAYDRQHAEAKAAPEREHAARMARLQEQDLLNQIQAKEQGPVKRFTTFGGGVVNGWVTDPMNMNAYQRQLYLPNNATAAPDYPTVGQQLEGREVEPALAPAEQESPLNSRRLNDLAASQRLGQLTAQDQMSKVLQEIAALQSLAGRG